MVKNRAYSVAKLAIMFATIFVAMMLDRAISILPIGFSMAVVALLVTLSFCFLENKWPTAILSGLFFGLASFIKEFIMPSATLGQVFPPQYWLLVTIPPRLLMTTVAFAVYRLMQKLCANCKPRKRQIVSIAVASLCGLITNTFGFLTMLELSRTLYQVQTYGVFVLIYGLLATNILPEYLISIIGVPLVVLGVRRGLKIGIEGLPRQSEND
jgi:uncharacterized membrane protein